MARAAALPPTVAFRISTRTGFSLPAELALVALTLLVLFFLVYPTAWVIVASFKTPETMFSAARRSIFPCRTTSRCCRAASPATSSTASISASSPR